MNEDRKTLDMRPGDVVRVHQKIKEGEKTRIQVFEGLIIARKHGTEQGATFTVRKVASGVGVERIYPLYSPSLARIEVVKRSPKIRRAKLYYIREKAAKEQRKKMRHEFLESKIVAGDIEEKKKDDAEPTEIETEKVENESETNRDKKEKEKDIEGDTKEAEKKETKEAKKEDTKEKTGNKQEEKKA